MSTSISNLSTAEIKAALSDYLDGDQAEVIRTFIEDIGGLENAIAAVEMLSELGEAA